MAEYISNNRTASCFIQILFLVTDKIIDPIKNSYFEDIWSNLTMRFALELTKDNSGHLHNVKNLSSREAQNSSWTS